MTDQWTKAREAAITALWDKVDPLLYLCEADVERGLDAALSALRDHGYVVVPEKLSHKMARAWEYGPNGNPEDSLEDYWQPSYRDMITAAEKERE